MRIDEMEVTSFSTQEPQRRGYAPVRYGRTARGRRTVQTRAGSMLAKIGFCLAVLALAVLAQRYAQNAGTTTRTALTASTDAGERKDRETEEAEDVLGRLQFVDAGGVRSVFAASQRWNMPVPDGRTHLAENDTLLEITSAAGETVSVAAAGEVRAISNDAALGDYIRIHHGGDLESVYYNLKDIRVEVGQPLLARDTLGLVGDTGVLYVSIAQSGVPQQPEAYLDIPD